MLPGIRAAIETGAARLGARLRRYELDTRRARRPQVRRRSPTSSPGSGASTSRCPRSATGSRSTASPRSLLCPDERSAAQLEHEGVAAAAAVVGDVMADVHRLFAPVAHARTELLERLGVVAGGVPARHGPPRGERPAGAARPDRRRPQSHSPSRSSSRLIRARGLRLRAAPAARASTRSPRSATSTSRRSPRTPGSS